MERPRRINYRKLLQSPDKHPLIARNGGILIKDSDISTISLHSTFLANFLISRTMSIRGLNPVRRDQPKGTKYPLFESTRGLRTSIDRSYFEINHQNGDSDKPLEALERRKDNLLAHLKEDARLFANWEGAQRAISALEEPDQKRIKLALFQIFTNDSSALNYAVKLANTHGAEIDPVTNRCLRIATEYYSMLLGKPESENLAQMGDVFSEGVGILAKTAKFFHDNLPFVDYIRSRREADDIRVLGAAKTFMQEDLGKSQPYVVIPLLGGYDIAPALISLGYPEEKIAFVVSHKKELSGEKRKTEEHTVTIKEFDHSSAGVVLFDDSISDGGHTRYVLRELSRLGIKVSGVRIIFRGKPKGKIPLKKVIEHLGVDTRIYYKPEYVGGREDSSTATRQKAATVEMTRRNSTLA